MTSPLPSLAKTTIPASTVPSSATMYTIQEQTSLIEEYETRARTVNGGHDERMFIETNSMEASRCQEEELFCNIEMRLGGRGTRGG